MEHEVWKPVPGYGNHYEASSLGRIRVKDRIVVKKCVFTNGQPVEQKYKGRLLSLTNSSKLGHKAVHISVNGEKQTVSVHKMILLAFVGPCPGGMEACHNDGVASNNRPDNLRWDTHFNNNRDRVKHGTYAVGDKHPMAKLSEQDVIDILASQDSNKKLAKKYGVGASHIWKIRRREVWSHLT